MTKKSRQRLKYLVDEKSFWDEIKNIFHNFRGLSVAKKSLRSESAPLNSNLFPFWNPVTEITRSSAIIIVPILFEFFKNKWGTFSKNKIQKLERP